MKKNLFIAEWREIFRNRKLLIPILAVALVPILYSGMFLWAFWDPYDKLKDLPVAVVNNDKGATFEGEELHLGKDLADKLKENDQFHFTFVNSKQGYKGLQSQKYYMLVEIPKDFSSNATTLMDKEPKKMELNYIPNEGFNFLSAQIGETAVKEIKAAVSKEVIAAYTETMFDKVNEMADGFDEASEGAKQLSAGAGKVNEGSEKLKENLGTLASKSIDFQNGVTRVQDGTGELASGSKQLAEGLSQLSNGQKQLAEGAKAANEGAAYVSDGAKQLKAGIDRAEGSVDSMIDGSGQLKEATGQLAGKLAEFQGGADQAAKGAEDLHAGISQMKEQVAGIDSKLSALPLPEEVKAQISEQLKAPLQEGIAQLEAGSSELASGTKQLSDAAADLKQGADMLNEKMGVMNEGHKQLKAGLGELSIGSANLADGAGQLASGQSELLQGMETLGQKIDEAKGGAEELAGGAEQVNGGMDQLSAGSAQLSEGSKKLVQGSSELSDGTKQLDDGVGKMKDKLGEAAEKAGSVHADDKTFDMMGEPVKVENHPLNKVPNYGTGFAPYFLSLGLFVGALLLSIVFPLREPAVQPKNGFAWFIGKFGVVSIVGVLQALLASAVLLYGLGIEVKSVPLFILTAMITSLAFVALVQFLVTLLGDPGRFIAIIILILQLTTSAGTFPLELIPKQLQWFNAVLPMTYSVQAFKAVISSGDFGFMWMNVGILSFCLLAFIAGTLGYFIYRHRKQYSARAVAES